MLVLAVAVALAAAPPTAPPPKPAATPQASLLPTVEATYHHDLTSPTGRVRLTWPSIAYDRAHDETFVVAEGFVRIFDATGMEVHRFGDDGSLGQVMRAVPLEDGEIVVLTQLEGRRAYLRCDFRGELIARFGLTGLPESLDDFEPDQLVRKGGRLYFAERGRMRVVVTDAGGAHLQSFNLHDIVAAALPADGERKPPMGMDAFSVDAAGNLLFTMSTLFAGAVLAPSGELRLFGSRGSRPGKFNIIGGIDADEEGTVFVTDRLRSVVSVWDRQLRHLGDFGYRGDGKGNLITPYEIAVGNGKVLVTQAAKRGVKVFRVRLIPPEPDPKAPMPAPARSPRSSRELG